jgi:hypothetical protein
MLAEPVIMIPLRRNENFVGRDEIFDELGKKLVPRPGYQAIASLYGLGGVG